MPRKIVPLVTDEIYHIYNRGVDKRNVFESESHYKRFYVSMKSFNVEKPTGSLRAAINDITDNQKIVSVIAYSLLPNHFHLLLKQTKDGGISEFMKRVQGGYTSFFNEETKRSGSLFQGTFKRVHIDTNEYLNFIFCYINENHTVHNISIDRKIYHSSSLHYQGIIKSKLLANNDLFSEYNFSNSVALAKDIYLKRLQMKQLVLE